MDTIVYIALAFSVPVGIYLWMDIACSIADSVETFSA